MKLKDFKDRPRQYEDIIESCRQKGIPVNDESDVSDLIGQMNSFNGFVSMIAGARGVMPGKTSTENLAADMIAAAANKSRT